MENEHTAVTRASFTNQEWFWIVGVRHMANHLTRKCVTCKKLRNKPLEQLIVLVLLEKQRLKQQRQSMINQLKKNSTAYLSYTAWLKLTYVVQRNKLLNQLLNSLSAPRGSVLHSAYSQRYCIYYKVLINSHNDILGYISDHTVLDAIKIEQKRTRFFGFSPSES